MQSTCISSFIMDTPHQWLSTESLSNTASVKRVTIGNVCYNNVFLKPDTVSDCPVSKITLPCLLHAVTASIHQPQFVAVTEADASCRRHSDVGVAVIVMCSSMLTT